MATEASMPSTSQSYSKRLEYYQHQPSNYGMKEDIFEFLQQTVELFDQDGTLRICHFQTVWKTMKFGLIFHGRQDYRELFEFTEDLLDKVKKYCKPTISLATRAAAFYLLYVLYYKQPLRPIVKIRVTYDEYENLVEWMNDLRADSHWELVYCWAKLVSDRAFTFVASTRHLGLEFSSKMYKPKGDTELQEPSYREHFFSSNLEILRKSHSRYTSMKRVLMSNSGNISSPGSTCSSEFRRPLEFRTLSSDASEQYMDKMIGLVSKVHKKVDTKKNKPKSDIGLRRKKIIEKSFGISGINPNEVDDKKDISTDIDYDPNEPKKKRKKKLGKVANKKKVSLNPYTDDIKSLAKSLKAVEEDPSLLLAFDEYGAALGAKRKKGFGKFAVSETGSPIKKKVKKKFGGKKVGSDEAKTKKKSKAKGTKKGKKGKRKSTYVTEDIKEDDESKELEKQVQSTNAESDDEYVLSF